MKKKINIVMTTDENYIIPTMVTISSILSSASNNVIFDIYILCKKELICNPKNLLGSLEEKNDRIKIKYLPIQDERLEKAITMAHIPVASYYRLYISKFLLEDRCLFVDGDMIIKNDLQSIYDTDLEDYYVAAVRDMGIQNHKEEYRNYAQYLGIPTMENYVNAGFMLFNLKKIRQDHLEEKMIAAVTYGYKYMDQDILNKYCYGKIKILPNEYDFFTEYYDETISKNIFVYHFTGAFKPWICTRLSINTLWWEEAKKVLDSSVYDEIRNNAEKFELENDWNYIRNIVIEKKDIAIFGFSEIGKKIAQDLLDNKTKTNIFFVDNDKQKEGMLYQKIKVLSAARAYAMYPRAVYIITSQNGYKQITGQLQKLGIAKSQIYRYIYKDETYFRRLMKSYVEYEMKQKI